MRQTSRAVALLLALESAQGAAVITNAINLLNAAVYPTQLVPLGGGYFDLAGAISSRSAPYNSCPGWLIAPASTVTNCPPANYSCTTAGGGCAWGNISVGTTLGATPTATTGLFAGGTTAAGSLCVPCIQQGGVWCSRTFSYNLISTIAEYQCNSLVTATRNYAVPYAAINTAFDNGQCQGPRQTIQNFNFKLAGTIATALETTEANAGVLLKYNGYASVMWNNVQKDASTALLTAQVFNVNTGARASWWCSNGFYHQVTATGSTSASHTDNFSQVIPDNANQRLELALVGCPQLTKVCGLALANTDAGSGSTNLLVVPLNKATFTISDKCTFVAHGLTNPPAFMIGAATGSGSTSTGILATSNWVIHHMEYNTNQLPEQAALDYLTIDKYLDFTSKVPLFLMASGKYQLQRTWYGAGTSLTDKANWSSPYNNFSTATAMKGKQYYGQVATFGASVAGTDYSNLTTAATYDMRVVRYLPVQVVMNDNAMGVAVAAAYNTQKATYDSAKTMWNNYVAILTKNAKVDAFAAAFAPPKAPTVPPLPSMPWQPTGLGATMVQASASKQQSALGFPSVSVINTALQPASNEFWIVSDSVPLACGGGWGSFTASIIKYRSGWGKSYGTIGYEDTTANADYAKMGATYNALWQCSGSTAGAACPNKFTSNSAILGGTSGVKVANTVVFYVAISLWSTKSNATNYSFTATCATTESCFQLTWSKGEWTTKINALAAPAAMTAATAADALTGIVGAQALAASAAAALAAAALY